MPDLSHYAVTQEELRCRHLAELNDPYGELAGVKPMLLARFWSKVAPAAPLDCWRWTGALSNGYPVLAQKMGAGSKRLYIRGGRLALIIAGRPLPPGYHACHTCDNPPCVNPNHLFRGTQTDNLRDASIKGRLNTSRCRGEENPNATLTAEQVLEIRRLLRDRVPQKAIAAQFGVIQAAISHIACGRNWSHLKETVDAR